MNDGAPLLIDNQPIEIDSSVLSGHEEALNKVFRMYIEDINPFIARFEVAKCEFPVEVQNEIRAMYGHLIRATMSKDPAVVERNIEKMYSHSKRALLDCFKYTCIVFSDNYDSFMSRYEAIDLTYIEEGKFLPRVVQKCNTARKKLQDAKISDTSNISEDEQFNMYQDAYREFEELNAELEAVEKTASFLQHKATKKDKFSVASMVVGIAGFLVGVIGIIVAVVL